jgi:hypothetical protein
MWAKVCFVFSGNGAITGGCALVYDCAHTVRLPGNGIGKRSPNPRTPFIVPK